MKKRLPLLLLVFSPTILVLSGCRIQYPAKSVGTNHKDINNSAEGKSHNISKVLNRVECTQDYCSQEYMNAIWQVCIENGYQVNIPQKKISDSRDIKELVQGIVPMKTISNERTERVDEIGIVTYDEEERYITQNIQARGYCIGSEYILENMYQN